MVFSDTGHPMESKDKSLSERVETLEQQVRGLTEFPFRRYEQLYKDLLAEIHNLRDLMQTLRGTAL